MPWFNVDDGFAFHRKAVQAGNAAIGLWTRAGSWCAGELTDGFVPDHMIRAMRGTAIQTQRLVQAGLWVRDDARGGFQFHEWSENGRNLTREEVLKKREDAAIRKRNSRENQAQKNARPQVDESGHSVTDDGVTRGVTHGRHAPTPLHSPPSIDKKTSSSRRAAEVTSEERADVEQLCERLRDGVIANGSKAPKITKTWREEARRLLDIDGRELDKSLALIDWAMNDTFWRANVRSIPTFREKYDQLRLKALSEWERDNGNRGPQRNGRPETGSKRVDKSLAALHPDDPFLAEYAAAQQEANASHDFLVIEGGRTA